MKVRNRIFEAIFFPFFGGCLGFLIGGTGVFLVFISFYEYLGEKYLLFIFYSGMISLFLGYFAGFLFYIRNRFALYGFIGSILGLLVGILVIFQIPLLATQQGVLILTGFSIMGFALGYYIKLSINSLLK